MVLGGDMTNCNADILLTSMDVDSSLNMVVSGTAITNSTKVCPQIGDDNVGNAGFIQFINQYGN